MMFMEILQLDCYAVQELPLPRNPLRNCIISVKGYEGFQISGSKINKLRSLFDAPEELELRQEVWHCLTGAIFIKHLSEKLKLRETFGTELQQNQRTLQ